MHLIIIQKKKHDIHFKKVKAVRVLEEHTTKLARESSETRWAACFDLCPSLLTYITKYII